MAPPFLFSVILHEIAHGLAAEHFGDKTARKLGRITLNPISHIDPFLSLILPGLLIFSGSPIIFGGAKPVPVNAMVFKNPRREMAYVAIAGPLTNFALALLCYLLYSALFNTESPQGEQGVLSLVLMAWLVYGILINVVLGVFNLIPFPPLDGGRVAVGFLPLSLARFWAKLEPFGIFIVIALLYFGLIDWLLEPALKLLENLIFL
jgi:Zn-dependent protease